MVRCVCVCARAIVGAMERATHLEAFRIGMRGGAVGFFAWADCLTQRRVRMNQPFLAADVATSFLQTANYVCNPQGLQIWAM